MHSHVYGKNRPTTYDIARKAGVNQSTVSRVLAGSPLIRAATAERVLQACHELEYVPNLAGRALRTNQSRVVAVDIPFGAETVTTDPFVLEFLAAVHREASSQGYGVMLTYATGSDDAGSLGDMVRARRADGILLTSPLRHDTRLPLLAAEGIPCVTSLQEDASGPRLATVDMDNEDMGRRAVAWLVARGRRRIGILTQGGSWVGEYFRRGCLTALGEAGVALADGMVRDSAVTLEGAAEEAAALLACEPPATAILSNTALGALGALEAVRRASAHVLVLGLESPLLRFLYPRTPCIRVPTERLARTLTSTLVAMLRDPALRPEPCIFRAEIVDEDGHVVDTEAS